MLSMSYTATGSYSGELFYTFDSFGNTSTLTDSQGNKIVGYLYDLNNGAIKNEYNPQGIDNPYKGGGKDSIINISDFLKISNCTSLYLANKWSDIIIVLSVVPPPKRGTDLKIKIVIVSQMKSRVTEKLMEVVL